MVFTKRELIQFNNYLIIFAPAKIAGVTDKHLVGVQRTPASGEAGEQDEY